MLIRSVAGMLIIPRHAFLPRSAAQSFFLRGCSCCRCSADADIKDKSEVFVCTSCHVISLSATRICQRHLSNTHTRVQPQTHHVIFLLKSSLVSPPFCHILYPSKPIWTSWIKRLKCMNTVSSRRFLFNLFIYFYWFWNIWLVRLIGYKVGINVIQPGGGSLLGREGNRPPPGSRTAATEKRQINPPHPPAANGK